MDGRRRLCDQWAEVLISVVLCTYNPDDELLGRALDAILAQSLDSALWDLLVVDNNSSPAVSSRACALSRGVRVVIEPKQGLAHARECGVCHTEGSILVFVDDDNVISPGYLEAVAEVFRNPGIGVVSGAVFPEYETQPGSWFADFENMLAVRRPRTRRAYLTTIPSYNDYFPIGAGMAVRREIMRSYHESITAGSELVTGRTGSQLSSAEDVDLDFFALSQGYLIGTVGSMELRHVIPAGRTTPEYLSRLTTAATVSAAQVNAKWSGEFGGNVIEYFNTPRRKTRFKCLVAGALRWLPAFRVRYHFNKTLLELTRPCR